MLWSAMKASCIIQSSEKRIMEPHNPSFDAIETCGEEVWLLVTGTHARKVDYCIKWGREGARMLSEDASVCLWALLRTAWQMWYLFVWERDAKSMNTPYFLWDFLQNIRVFAKTGSLDRYGWKTITAQNEGVPFHILPKIIPNWKFGTWYLNI